MPNVELYGDRHNSEQLARRIQASIAGSDPEALMLESPDMRGEKASHTVNSLVNYPTLNRVYQAFGLDTGKIEGDKQVYPSPMYEVDVKQLENSLEALIKKFNISVGLERIVSHNNIVLSEEKDRAVTALFQNIQYKESNDKNTLLPRLSVLILNENLDFYTLDFPKPVIFRYAAEHISQAPSTSKQVKNLMQKARNGRASNKEAEVAKAILNKTTELREKKMAKQILNNGNAYNEIAVVVGRGHVKSISEKLTNHGIQNSIQTQ